MKPIEWNKEKNDWLKEYRKISFEEVTTAIHSKRILKEMRNPNRAKYPHQNVLVVNIHNYAYVVPFVEDEIKIFLKTIYPSRKYTKKYLRKERYEAKKI